MTYPAYKLSLSSGWQRNPANTMNHVISWFVCQDNFTFISLQDETYVSLICKCVRQIKRYNASFLIKVWWRCDEVLNRMMTYKVLSIVLTRKGFTIIWVRTLNLRIKFSALYRPIFRDRLILKNWSLLYCTRECCLSITPIKRKLVNLLNQNVFHSLSFICLAYKPKKQETYEQLLQR